MSREIRRVPPGWEHPVNEVCRHRPRCKVCYRPLYDADHQTRAEEWEREYAAYLALSPEERKTKYPYEGYYWEWEMPPDRDHYREQRWTPEEAMCYQVYEDVSEGTPISPVFETAADMRAWLIAQGHSEYATDEFIRYGWAPSMVAQAGRGVSEIGIDSYDFFREEP